MDYDDYDIEEPGLFYREMEARPICERLLDMDYIIATTYVLEEMNV